MIDDCPNLLPEEFALELFKDLERKTGTELSELADTSFVHCLIGMHPGIKAIVTGGPESTYYEIDPDLAAHFSVCANGSNEIAQVVLRICSANIFTGHPVPFAFRGACLSLMLGEKVWPKPRGRTSAQDFGRFWLAYGTTKLLRDAYEIDIARHDGGPATSAADFVASALTEMEIPCTYTNVRDWCQHAKHMKNRARADFLSRLLAEQTLTEIGLLKKWENPVEGIPDAYARIRILGRMT